MDSFGFFLLYRLSKSSLRYRKQEYRHHFSGYKMKHSSIYFADTPMSNLTWLSPPPLHCSRIPEMCKSGRIQSKFVSSSVLIPKRWWLLKWPLSAELQPSNDARLAAAPPAYSIMLIRGCRVGPPDSAFDCLLGRGFCRRERRHCCLRSGEYTWARDPNIYGKRSLLGSMTRKIVGRFSIGSVAVFF